MLTLRGVDYGNIFCAPGARGFFGEGYPYHRWAERLGMTWDGTGFVSKTITFPARAGNMPLRRDGTTPKERLIPRSIVVKFRSGHVLNAVGLSNAGSEWAVSCGRWQERTDAFMISFMSVAGTPDERLAETKHFVEYLARHKDRFKGKPALQANRACPNTGHPPSDFYAETEQMLDILADIGWPIVVNFNPTVPTQVLEATAAHEACDALWIANTIPWGDPRINWQKLFGSTESPLAQRKLNVPGGGGLSGPDCLGWTVDSVRTARAAGITKPIVAGNGIQRQEDVRWLFNNGADAVAIGTVGMVRPWRMKSIIEEANKY